ncbi:purine-nucleoside phosphorylase [Helicobacter monodelphidis]|uniref:purine-nucleoside phosphorylase n=1 Tax=Helicobacter sp. 15-1451 TaxID=2004995 RepID=UPI000DCD243E|nr:purine-nucleoside phosphorylase [Helicobacter sp. 15-1451]RAX58044.1 purine-nucleoside phosphorylase [Helicobacter sp. 15-1451]
MFISAGEMETFDFAKSIGIGLVNASIGLSQLILQESVQELIFIGTAGSYDKNEPLLNIIESQHASQIELSFLSQQSYTPIENIVKIDFQEKSPIVNSSNYITTDINIAEAFLKLGIFYENMEFFSVLRVAKTFKIPAKGIFCITNHTDKNARDSFLKHSRQANTLLESYVRKNYAEYL